MFKGILIISGILFFAISCKKEKTAEAESVCTTQPAKPPCSPPVFDSTGAKIYTVYNISNTPDSLDPNANFILFFKRGNQEFRMAMKEKPHAGEYLLVEELVENNEAVVQLSLYNNWYRFKSQSGLGEKVYFEQVVPGVFRLTICTVHLKDFINEVLTFYDIGTVFDI